MEHYLKTDHCEMLPVSSVSTALLTVDMDLIHCQLGHAHMEQSDCYFDAAKARLHSHITLPCRICALSKQGQHHTRRTPTTPVACMQLPGEIMTSPCTMHGMAVSCQRMLSMSLAAMT